MKKEFIIAIDFDGTCVTHDYPKIGNSIGAEPVLRELTENGVKLILWTMRTDEYLAAAVNWFKERNIPLWGICENPNQHTWSKGPKVYANLYIDDAALGAPLKKTWLSDRFYLDWAAAKEMLLPLLPSDKKE